MSRRLVIDLACLATFALMPLVAALFDEPFLVSLFTRLAIYGMAAASLDLRSGGAPLEDAPVIHHGPVAVGRCSSEPIPAWYGLSLIVEYSTGGHLCE